MQARALALIMALGLALPSAVGASTTIDAITLDGEPVRLTDYFDARKWTLVMVWTTYCAVCEREFPIVAALHDAHRNDDFKVLGLSVDGEAAVERVAATLAERRPGFNSLVAEPAEVAAGYRRLTGESFDGTPTYLLFDAEGELAAHMSGPLDTAAVEQFIVERRH